MTSFDCISLVTDTSGEALLDGTPLSIAIRQIAAYRPEAILTNCASPAASVMAVQILAEESKLAEAAWGVGSYPNSSAPDPVEGWARVSTVTDEAFDRSIAEMLRAGAGYVGSCCGTGPETTERIVRMVRALAGETGSS